MFYTSKRWLFGISEPSTVGKMVGGTLGIKPQGALYPINIKGVDGVDSLLKGPHPKGIFFSL